MLGTSSTAPTGTRAWSDAASGSGHTKNFTRRQFWEDQLRSKGSGQMTPEEEIDAAVDDVKNAVSTLSRGINCNAGGFTFQRYKCPTNSEKLQAAGTVFSYSRGGRGRGSASGAAKGGPRSIDDLDLDELSASGAGRVGRKLEQHQGGPFPPVRGGPAAKERLGQEQLDDILTHPGSRVEDTTGGAFKGGFYVIAPDGRGAAFDASRKFLYFGEFK